MESAVSFAPLRPADFVNFVGRGKACFLQGGAGQGLLFAGQGSLFFLGEGQPSLVVSPCFIFSSRRVKRRLAQRAKRS